jgi:hypothetical protein
MMSDIYDADGNEIGAIALSARQRALLDAGENIAVLYHTPQLLRDALGHSSGSFMLRKDGDRLVTLSPEAAKECVRIQKAVAAARDANA